MITQSSFEDVYAIANNFEGWLDIEEAKLLYNIASNLKGKGVIVEIGSWCAKSLTLLTKGALNNDFANKIYSIDPFLTSKDEPNGKYETFLDNLKKNDLLDKIIHIKEKSQIAGLTFNEKIEFIFIDGFHKYEAVKQDFDLYFPKIVDNGYIAIHDIGSYQGPTDLVIELAQAETFKILDFKFTTLLAQKVQTLSKEDKENNRNIINNIKTAFKNSSWNLIQ